MYKNNVQLIGFIGNDAETRTNDSRSLTRFSLATKSSYKRDGKHVEHTEWHKCVVFGKLSDFASSLRKGAHVLVEGEIRTREYDSAKTGQKESVTEIRVDSILKLDRAAKAVAEEHDNEDAPSEGVAA